MDELTNNVIKIISETEYIPIEKITPDSTFEELGIDSLGSLRIIFELESKYNISIPDDQAYQIQNVRQAVENLQLLLNAESPAAETAAMNAEPVPQE